MLFHFVSAVHTQCVKRYWQRRVVVWDEQGPLIQLNFFG